MTETRADRDRDRDRTKGGTAKVYYHWADV